MATKMAYNGFAYLYDELNMAADYDALCAKLVGSLRQHGIRDGIVADLGCGTGEVTLRLAEAGYDMIGIDASEDMLTVFREKLAEREQSDILLLLQPLEELDLYGTIRAAVSTFDTFNHLPREALRKALGKAALFMEEDGVLVFDVNTPYKHEVVLANESFAYEDEGFTCTWCNTYRPELPGTCVMIRAMEDGEELFSESFLEYAYTAGDWQVMLREAGFRVAEVLDGESFGPVGEETQRWLYVCKKS